MEQPVVEKKEELNLKDELEGLDFENIGLNMRDQESYVYSRPSLQVDILQINNDSIL